MDEVSTCFPLLVAACLGVVWRSEADGHLGLPAGRPMGVHHGVHEQPREVRHAAQDMEPVWLRETALPRTQRQGQGPGGRPFKAR